MIQLKYWLHFISVISPFTCFCVTHEKTLHWQTQVWIQTHWLSSPMTFMQWHLIDEEDITRISRREGGRGRKALHRHKLDLKEILPHLIFCRTPGKKEIILRSITLGLSDPVQVDTLVRNGQTQILQALECQCLMCVLDSGTLSQGKVIHKYFDTIISNSQCTYQELSQVETYTY